MSNSMQSSSIQSVLFDRKIFTTTEARSWLSRNNLQPIKRVDKTKNLLRYRIKNPNKFKRFRIIQAPNSTVKFVIGFPNFSL